MLKIPKKNNAAKKFTIFENQVGFLVETKNNKRISHELLNFPKKRNPPVSFLLFPLFSLLSQQKLYIISCPAPPKKNHVKKKNHAEKKSHAEKKKHAKQETKTEKNKRN